MSTAATAGQRVASLTGIRAFAAFAVLVTHAAYWTGHYSDDYPGRLWARAEVGVAIFFVLSGYLLFRPWVRSATQPSAALPSSTTYFIHRARRILPAYWLTVIVVYLVYAMRDHAGPSLARWLPTDPATYGTGWGGFVRNMTLTQVYGFGHLHAGLTQMWSLAAEVVYYLMLPPLAWLLVVVVSRRSPTSGWRPDLLIAGLAAVMLVSPIWTFAVAIGSGADTTARLWAPAFVAWFAAGMMLAVCRDLIRRWPAWPSVSIAVVLFAVSASTIAGGPTIIPDTAPQTVVKHLLYLLISVALIGPLTVADDTAWSRLCGSRPVAWLGEISYEIFLVHVIVLECVMAAFRYRTFGGDSVLVVVAVTALASIPPAWALHRLT
ncbi:acyltransferase [Gordonia sp. TBRC 11910]|uniref:Acyltransferase n=1 Tax=Gordonia asplenii TaxID=2725283 RepID=A0A848KYN3_9ACTN|nr:acyltransferase [Gordonia asplenii]NMO03844.1 acyltransferase [Gordonia asplenii]